MEVDKKLFGKRLKTLRLEIGMTLEEFGTKVVNSNKSVVSKWENGISLPNPERLKIIAEFFDTTVEELLEPNPIFKNRIKKLRKEQNLTLEDLSEELDIRLDLLNMYEKGNTHPQLGLIKEIANYFNVSFNYLIFQSDVRDYPVKSMSDIIKVLDLLQKEIISVDDISDSTIIVISYFYYKNVELFLENEQYKKYIDTINFLSSHVISEHKMLEVYKTIRMKENITLETINEKLLDTLEYSGASAKQVLEFMKQSERIDYEEIDKIIGYMKTLPDAKTEED